MTEPVPRRGQIWLAELGAARPGELGKTRPVVIVSADTAEPVTSVDLLIVVPLSASRAPSLARPKAQAGEGLDRDSVAVCRAVTSVARSRLVKPLGQLPAMVMSQVSLALLRLMDLDMDLDLMD